MPLIIIYYLKRIKDDGDSSGGGPLNVLFLLFCSGPLSLVIRFASIILILFPTTMAGTFILAFGIVFFLGSFLFREFM